MIILFALLLGFLVAPVEAQDPAAPGEPDIVLPEVILRIEDFSVEKLTGAAPGEQESLPPARELPLPAGEEPLLTEPPAPPDAAEGPAGQPEGPEQKPLSALVELGAGNSRHLYSRVALYGLGEEPRFSLRFLHETLDGIAGQADPGSGFDFRQEQLEGGLKFHLGQAGIDLEGALREEERGLQGNSAAAASRLERAGSLGADLVWPFAEAWTLSGFLAGSFAEQLLTGAAPTKLAGQKLVPGLSLEVRTSRFWLGVDGRYAFQVFDGEPAHRASALGRFGVDISKAARLEGGGGWHWSELSEPAHLFPFDLTLSLTPSPEVSIVAAGGGRVEELDAGEVAAAFPWAVLPDPLLDDPVLFGDLTASFSFLRVLSLQAGAHLAWHRKALWPQPTLTGDLFSLDQLDKTRLAVEASLRWSPARESYVGASWRTEVLEHPFFSPGTELRLEAGAGSAKWGAHGSVAFGMGFAPPPPRYTLTPELSLGAFFQASEAVRLAVEVEDLLSPISEGGVRWDWDPFLAPGFRAMFKVQINL